MSTENSPSKASYLELEEYQNRLKKLQELEELGIDPYPHQYTPHMNLRQVQKNWENDAIGDHAAAVEARTPKLAVAGRLILLRAMGKNIFAHIQDHEDKLQLMFSKAYTEFEGYSETEEGPKTIKLIEKKLDLGDILGVEGFLFRTQKGELTLLVQKLTLLSKSLLPLPDKHSGLEDKEVRYRKRWLDLIANPEVTKTFKLRSKLIKRVRDYFYDNDFIEVETPIMQNLYGGAAAKPFTTHLNALNQEMYLRISLEIALKKLLVGGLPRIFEISKVFRNEGIDRTHNPEFTMIEAYAAFWDYEKLMVLMENLFEQVAKDLNGTTKIKVDDHEIDLKAPWRRLSMIDSIIEYADVDVRPLSEDKLRNIMVERFHFDRDEIKALSKGALTAKLFEQEVEHQLIQPTHLIDHPIETTPLCKLHRDPKLKHDGIVERFESFIAGREICNAYSELNHPVIQRQLLEDQARARLQGDEEAHPLDEEFIEAICQGMPPAAGIGIGIDRFVMLISGDHSIRDVLFFPMMKPKGTEA